MDIKEFGMAVLVEVGKRIGSEYKINVGEYPQNNGVVKHGLCILTRYTNASPCIYLDEFYARYRYGAITIDEIVSEVIRIHREHLPKTNWDTTAFTDYEKARKNLRFRLINTEKNAEMLKSLPHREFLDLSLIYRVEFPCEDGKGFGSICVQNKHVGMWAVDEDELFRQAKENMERANESTLEDIEDLLKRMKEEFGFQWEEDLEFPMYILSNKKRLYGAIQILDESALREAANLLGEEIMILPSSVHEILLAPALDNEDGISNLVKTVKTVNDTQLDLNEILSYHVYRYSVKTGRIVIAA
jgi:hypothetical protein